MDEWIVKNSYAVEFFPISALLTFFLGTDAKMCWKWITKMCNVKTKQKLNHMFITFIHIKCKWDVGSGSESACEWVKLNA